MQSIDGEYKDERQRFRIVPVEMLEETTGEIGILPLEDISALK